MRNLIIEKKTGFCSSMPFEIFDVKGILFYSEDGKYWLCVVTKQTGLEGFIITAYITDKVKEGEIVWQK